MKEIVLVGRPNVGKSSLVRAITGIRVRVGKRPGVTRRILRLRLDGLTIVDMPGFGFMAGVSRKYQEKIKREIVEYLEKNSEKILFGVLVVDAKSFLDIAERWEGMGKIPFDVEMFNFLNELHLNPIVVVHKIDMVYADERDVLLDRISEKLGLLPPWRQWLDTIVPTSTKTGEGLATLLKLIEKRLRKRRMEKYLVYFRRI